VTTVYFLFLLHLSLGLMGALLLVPDQAGQKFFKLCSATATLLTAAGLGLLYRRYGTPVSVVAIAGRAYRPMLTATAAFLAFAVVYNRAWHFDWARVRRPLLLAAIAAGVAASLLTTPGPIFAVAGLTSALLLGAAASAMILGHYYLVVLDLPIAALRRLTVLLIAALILRSLVVGFVLTGPAGYAYEEADLIAHGLWSADGIFVWMRLLFGIAGPLSLSWFIWKTVEIRSTQSATGILYVQLFLVLAGELLATYLRVAAGFAL
jgi:hypothetical protein